MYSFRIPCMEFNCGQWWLPVFWRDWFNQKDTMWNWTLTYGKNRTLLKINDSNLSDTVFEIIRHRCRDRWRFQLIICWYGDIETLSHHWSFVGEIDRWLGDSTNWPVMRRFAVSFVLVQMNCLPNDEVVGNPRHHIAHVVSLEWEDMPLTV